ncbi:MarR family transcriptional regulator [Kitasatospora sp. NPDC097643]|uniref:helix-turn-helix transcriptional regulator n=1 Tax=Kitasatospora sp. NPDC097643 TaxID=3157230 RepID=UPI00331B21C7
MKLTIDPTRIPGPAIAALGALNAFAVEPGSAAFSLSLCVTVSGLLSAFDDIHELGLRRDRKVIAHLAKVPDGARVRQIGNALDLADRTVARSLDRLAADGLVVREAEGESLPMRSYRLAD